MASYQDIIPQFNPYIKQLPTEAMAQVGMEKQRRYDEGVQKIQQNIDNVAGLDVIRDVDKQYLQSMLNNLGSRLKTVAAGDFSNYQLVNSVGGMAKQIGRDNTIQNAVSSTSKYRKELGNKELYKKEGKTAIQNDWDFNNKASAWLNSGDINATFNDSYTPYTDVQKKWFDVLKTLHSDLREEDIPYEKNDDGTINYNKTAAAMQRISKETLSSQKIENALRSSLTPDELNQLSIDGRYTFRGIDTPEKLSVYASSKYTSQIANTDKVIEKLTGLANLASSDPIVKEQALRSIEDLKQRKSSLQSQLKEELEDITTNFDGAKTRIYKNGAITQFAEAHSWEHNKSNLLSNPILEAEHWEKKFALDRSEFNLRQSSQSWRQHVDSFNMDLDRKKFDLSVEKQNAELYGSMKTPFEVYLGNSTEIKAPLVAMDLDAMQLEKSANDKIGQMLKGIPNTSVDQINQAISDYNSGDATKVGLAKNIIPGAFRGLAQEIIEDQASAKRLRLAVSNTRAEIVNSPEFKESERKFNQTLATLKPIGIKTASGNVITITPKEISDFLQKEKDISSISSYEGQGWYPETYNKPLSSKEKLIEDAVKKGLIPKSTVDTYRNINGGRANTIKKIDDKVNEELLKKSGSYLPRLTTITFGSGEGNIARRTWEGIASSVLASYDEDLSGMAGGSSKMSKNDAATIKDWLGGKDKEDIIYKKLTQGRNTYLVLSKGGEEKMIPLEAYQARQLPLADPNEPTEADKVLYDTQMMFNGNTNPTGKFEDSFFSRAYLPRIKKLDVKADLKWDALNNAQQYVTINLKTKRGTLPLSLDDFPMSRKEAINFIQSLTDEEVKQLFLRDSRIPDTWKEEIKPL